MKPSVRSRALPGAARRFGGATPKFTRTTRFTIFATSLMIIAMAVLYIMLVADVMDFLSGMGIEPEVVSFVGVRHLVLLVLVVIVAVTVSSLIIDSVLNPLRLMTSKIREIGQMNFTSPLRIDADDDELREYVFAFNNMSAKLNRYIEMQKRFVSDASHELATPITVINGHADLLLRRGSENPEILEGSLETIKTEILRMSGLVDSLLLLARSDSGHQSYSFERTDIASIVNDVTEETRLIAPEFTIEARLPDKLDARCDGDSIRRVMRILLSNAVRYSEENRSIIISAEESHGLVEVSVKDSGIGIPKESLPRIFERFYRVDTSRSKKTGSSGLGLAIAKEIIAAHSGEIKAISQPGNGTEIRFRISS